MSRRVFFRDSEAQGFSTYGLLLDTLFRQLKAVGVAGYFPYEYQEDMRCGYAELVSFFGEGFGRLAEQEGDTSNLSILSKHASLRGLLLEKYRKDNERYLAARNSLSIKSLKKAEEVNEPSWDKLYASAEAEDARREEGIRDSGEGKPDSAVVNSFLAAINGAHAVDDSSAPVYVEDDEEPVGGYFSDEDEEYPSELPDDDDDEEYSSELPDDDEDEEYSSELPDDDEDEEYSSELPDDDEGEEYSSELPDDEEDGEGGLSELPDDDDDDEYSSELPEDDEEDSSELPADDDDEYDEEDSSELPADEEYDEEDSSELPADDDDDYDEDSSELPDDDDDEYDEDPSELPGDDEYDEDLSELPADDDDEYDEDSSELPDDDEEDSSELPANGKAGYSPKLSAERVVPNPSVYVAPVVSNMVVRPSYARGIPGRETQEAVLDMMDRLANNIKGWFSRL